MSVLYVCVPLGNMFISFKTLHKDFKDLYNMREYETKSELLEVVRHPEQRTVYTCPVFSTFSLDTHSRPLAEAGYWARQI